MKDRDDYLAEPIPDELRWSRVASGLYTAAGGRVELWQIPGVHPAAWQVQLSTDYAYEVIADLAPDVYYGPVGVVAEAMVDGAATYRDAKAIAADEWPAVREVLRVIEAGEAGLVAA